MERGSALTAAHGWCGGRVQLRIVANTRPVLMPLTIIDFGELCPVYSTVEEPLAG